MRKAILSAAVAIGGLAGGQALAQGAPSDTGAAERLADANEIIVTARKRAETLQSVPVVAQAFRQETLQQYGTDSIAALTTRVPNLQAGTGVNAVGTQLSLRGVGTTALNATIDQSVSLNVDGLSLTQGTAYTAALFDLGQIEVLKGPQALFFGKNSPGGVISMRSADPTDAFELIGRVGYEFAARDKSVELVVSGPVSNTLKLRFAGRYSDMKGYFRNEAQVIPGRGSLNPARKRFPNADSLVLRGTALWEPNDAYSARLKVNYAKTDEDGSATPLDVGYCPDGTGGVAPTGIPFIAGDDCKIDNVFRIPVPDPAAFPGARNNARPFFTMEQVFGTLEQTLRLDDNVTLTSVTGYYKADMETIHAASTTGTVQVIIQDNDFSNRQFTQEMRLESAFDGPLNFMVGGFYLQARQMNHVRVRANQTLGILPPVVLAAQHYVDIDSYAGFGQLTLTPTETLEISAGARWTSEERDHIQYNTATGAPVLTTLIDPHIESANLSPELTVAYRPNPDLTLFGSYKWGFKSGSFNSATFINATTRSAFNDEKVQGAEFGVKSRLLDGALTLNLAAYRYKYKDLQVGALELQQLPGGGGITYALRTINAASAKVQGVELEARYAPPQVEGLSINLAANYNHARYGAFPNAPCGNGQTAAQGCNNLFSDVLQRFTAQDLSGRRLVRAPDWTASAGVDYETPVGRDMTLLLGANVLYSGKYSTTLVDLPGFEQGAFAKLAANIALRGPDDRWEIALIGNNLTNKYTSSLCFNSNLQNATVLGGQISGGTTSGPAGQDESACAVDRGRSVNLRLSFKL